MKHAELEKAALPSYEQDFDAANYRSYHLRHLLAYECLHSDRKTVHLAKVLIIDDNLPDARLMVEALRESRIPHHVRVVSTGDDALAYLFGTIGEEARPDIILLDINLPTIDGFEVMAKIKQNSDFRSIPIVLLSGTCRPEATRDQCGVKSTGYLQKPLDFGQLVRLLAQIMEFWLGPNFAARRSY